MLFKTNEKIIEEIEQKISLLDNVTEVEQEEIGKDIEDLKDSLCTVEELYEDFSENYNNTYRGQIGNGYFVTGSSTRYVDFFYGEDEYGEDVVLRYIIDEVDNESVLIYAEID